MSTSDLSELVKVCVICAQEIVGQTGVQDEAGNNYCLVCWDARQEFAQKIIVRINRGTFSRQIVIPAQAISIGSAEDNDIILPLPWVRPHHLLIQYDAGVARARTLDPAARALIIDRPISISGMMLPAVAKVTLPAPAGLPIILAFEFEDADEGMTILTQPTGKRAPTPVTEIVGVSPLDEERSIFDSPSQPAVHRRAQIKSWPRLAISLIGTAFVLAIVIAALSWNDIRRMLYSAAVDKQFTQVVQDITQAKSLIAQGQYIEAKSQIDDGLRLSANRPGFSDQYLILKAISAQPEIKLGGLGYVKMENQWLPPETASAWKSARTKDDPKIQSLFTQAQKTYNTYGLAASAVSGTSNSTLINKTNLHDQLISALQSCDQALALIAAEPVHPHPMQQRLTDLRNSIHESLVAAEMTAKGYILYNNRWVTPAEQFRLEQDAKGLALYKGKWISKPAAFAAEQTDKGLVLYQGHWITPDQEKTAQGFVKFENAWITPAQRAEIIQTRHDQAQAKKQQLEQQELAAQKEAERKLAEQKAIEDRFPDAYQMSQEFVKDILKSPATAKFQPYESAKVRVTYANGWYTVTAVVDADNSFGVPIRSTYVCKLKPVTGNKWQSANTSLQDN